MNVLVLSHVSLKNSYGAATSIRLHVEALENDISFYIFEQGFSLLSISRLISDDKKLAMPISGNYFFYRKTVLSLFYYGFRNFVAYLIKGRLLRIIDENNIGILHINSLVMLKLVGWLGPELDLRKVKVVSHVREVLNSEISKTELKGIKFVNKFICIDNATKIALHGIYPQADAVTITNPIRIENKNRIIGNRFEGKVVFALVGVNSEDKGTEFVCECFVEAGCPNSVLLLAGKHDSPYAKRIYSKYGDIGNIVFLGDLPNLSSTDFYSSIDVLIRGESIPCIGRTVIEAIYADKSVFLPGNPHDYSGDELIINSNDLIKYYSIRSSDQLSKLFRSFIKSSGNDRTKARGNMDSYRSKLLDIYREVTQ